MADIRIRSADVADAPTLVEFNRAIARETENMELDPGVVTAGVRALFEQPDKGFYLVAEDNGELAGCLMVTNEWSDWRNGMFWWIQSVYVRPDYRRQGVYRRLYGHARSLAADRDDVCGFRLYVERDNDRAQRTYQSLGMIETPYRVYETLVR